MSETTPDGITLVLGGARSGKSRHAEGLLGEGPAVYLATADPAYSRDDPEMLARIRQHQADRPPDWQTWEEPLNLGAVLDEVRDQPVLIDCLTLWLANVMAADWDPAAETELLLDALERRTWPVILVGNEVGLGIVPESALGREFRDQAGRLNQAVAAFADRVDLVVAGIPLLIKGPT